MSTPNCTDSSDSEATTVAEAVAVDTTHSTEPSRKDPSAADKRAMAEAAAVATKTEADSRAADTKTDQAAATVEHQDSAVKETEQPLVVPKVVHVHSQMDTRASTKKLSTHLSPAYPPETMDGSTNFLNHSFKTNKNI
jgi:hypothetical protein